MTTAEAAVLGLVVADGDADAEADGDELDPVLAGCDPQAASITPETVMAAAARIDLNPSIVTSE